ncbi:cupin domain-containing protein [Salidesulfovibrio brasiliensis]|uniref:cupin domain-containing protein n=1 Tax=Salidesulfovibrio brasiliensis TaxID=221711 RepID=UPI0006D1B3C9|nr:cupin domain-containing protein [Salidesulfovibrio brasiliensis]
MNTLFDSMSHGTVHGGCTRCGKDLDWNSHPSFTGVELKHLVTGADTDGGFSVHLVRIAPDCAIGEHDHPGSWELHEVAEGHGTCRLEESEMAYEPGTMAVLPAGRPHSVQAGKEGLKLLAKFVPALV